jgi:sec-independent protein translocase protein TatA
MELGFGEIVDILAIVLLLFGPSKLPKLGEGLGRAIRNFKDAAQGDEEPRSAGPEPRDGAQLPEAPAKGPAKDERRT